MLDRPITPVFERHRKIWALSWDFLGGTRSWSDAVKAFNAAKRAANKEEAEAKDAADLAATIPGGTPRVEE